MGGFAARKYIDSWAGGYGKWGERGGIEVLVGEIPLYECLFVSFLSRSPLVGGRAMVQLF